MSSLRSLRARPLTIAAALLASAGVASAQIGTPFQSPRLLNKNGANDTAVDDSVALSSRSNGFVLAVWSTTDAALGLGGDRDIVVATSRDDGATWTAPSAFATEFATDGTKSDVEPQVGAAPASYMVVWASTRNSASNAHGIFSAYGSGSFPLWVNALPVDTTLASDAIEDREPSVASSGGTWITVWQRTSGLNDEDIWFSRSTLNGGPSWSPGAPLQTNAATDSGGDTSPRIASDGAGHWVVVWQSSDSLGGTIGTDPDILYSRSLDDGLTWSAPAPLNSSAVGDGDLRDLQPAIAVDRPSGKWIATWSSNAGTGGPLGDDLELYVSISNDQGASWSPMAVLNTNAAVDSPTVGNDFASAIVADQLGRFVVTWQRRDPTGTDQDIAAARSDDLGVTWSAPTAVKTTSGSDTVADTRPAVAVTVNGIFTFAWQSQDTLGGTIGADGDLLFTRSMIPFDVSGTRFCFGSVEPGNPSPCPCGNDSGIALREGCRNSSGVGASLAVTGSSSVTFTTRAVTASGIVPNSPTLFFQGTNQVGQSYGTFLGDGLRCAGGSVRRLGVATANAQGNAVLVFSTAGIVVGDVRYYQGWYRDTAATCGSGFFNLTAAEARTWIP